MSRTFRPILVTAHLASPLCVGPEGPPQLDALLELAASATCDPRNGQGVDKSRLTRDQPPPEQGSIKIPLAREWLGSWLVARCSNAVVPECRETVEYVNKRLDARHTDLVDAAQHKQICHTNTWTKSYRLPMRLLSCDRVRWLAYGDQGGVHFLLSDRIDAIGKKISVGYGRVRKWTVDSHPRDCSWYLPHAAGQILMRTLPHGEWLPKDLLGYRAGYAACVGPYWHPARYTEVVQPC